MCVGELGFARHARRHKETATLELNRCASQNPEKQFDDEHLRMAKLMGITPEELAKTMSNTAK